MNLFYLDEDLDKSAQYHVDKHIVKMPLEAAQLLCLSLIHISEPTRRTPYLPMMYNHPCTIWTRSSLDNFEWVHCYANALNDEYYYRYGKLHKSVMEVVNKLPEPKNMPRLGQTPFGMAMPDELKDENDVVGSYRLYYHTDKATFAKWSHRDKPYWWDEGLAWYDQRITAK